VFEELSIARPLVVTDQGVRALGIADEVIAPACDPEQAIWFDRSPPNPTEAAVLEAAEAFRAGGVRRDPRDRRRLLARPRQGRRPARNPRWSAHRLRGGSSARTCSRHARCATPLSPSACRPGLAVGGGRGLQGRHAGLRAVGWKGRPAACVRSVKWRSRRV
jgi:hypothetical protein